MIAAIYQRLTRRASAGLKAFDFAVEKLSFAQSVLMLGCGTGGAAIKIAETAHLVVGVDRDPLKIKAAGIAARASTLENVDFTRRDLHDTKMPGLSFDLIFGRDVIADRNGAAILMEAKRLLVPGGAFISLETFAPKDAPAQFAMAFPDGWVERYGIVKRLSIFKAMKGRR